MTADHAYTRPGTYTVTVTARNDAGTARRAASIEVRPPPQPAQVASVTATPNPVDAGATVRFESDVEGDAPVSREWRFGDGRTATGAAPTHTYEAAGTYTARLQASNEAGTDARTVTVQVERARPAVCTTIREFNAAYFDRALTDEAQARLQENVEVLAQCPALRVRVEAFAAPGEPRPEALSADRAAAVARFYEAQGVPARRIEAEGQGAVEGITTKKGAARQYRRADSLPQPTGDAE